MLLTKADLKALPPLGSQDELGDQAIAYVKFFTPDSNWSWWAVEFSPEEGVFFGLVEGFEKELGHFTLKELESARGPYELAVERDRYWRPRTLAEIGL